MSASVNVVGSYTYTDADTPPILPIKAISPAQVPKHMASLWADYTFFDGPLSGLTLGTGGRILAPVMVIRLTPLKWEVIRSWMR
ncbi:hypothetical protein ACLK18_00870 [Escherichia coli]